MSKSSCIIAVTVSLLIHLVLLALLAQTVKKPAHQPDKPKTIQSRLVFLPKSKPAPKPVEKSQPVKEEKAKPAPEPVKTPPKTVTKKPESKVVTTKIKTTSPASPQPANSKVKTDKRPTMPKTPKPSASSKAYATMQNLLQNQHDEFINSVTIGDYTDTSIGSVNSISDSPVKQIFESAVVIDRNTRVVNYGGSCVQISRVQDFNGFSQFSWTATSMDCGADKGLKSQFKLSMDKFLKPHPTTKKSY